MNTSGSVSFNEMMSTPQGPRQSWEPLWKMINKSSSVDLDLLSQDVLYELNDQAVTYTIHGDANKEHPWDLDPLPFMLEYDEWQSLAQALDQRARCLNMLLADCHGDQKCIAEGLIPASYVFEHPDFLQDCRGWKPPKDTYLHCYAADVVRGYDGQWRVLADRCQSPLGIGYAMQNRFVIANALPELYQQMGVQRQRVFFDQLDKCLRACSTSTHPRIAVLAGSAFGDNDYEQAFLARYLGYELVTGQDLTVRDDKCYIKTVSGLSPLDIILRFVGDSWCDPMSFRADSTLGVPGLVRAAAAGNVVVANALGSGLLDSPVVRPLVAAACRNLLNEEPLIEGLSCLWGTDVSSAIAAKKPLIVKEAWNALRSNPVFTQDLSLPDLQALQERIDLHPVAWCADEPLEASVAPVLDDKRIGYRPISLRMYLVRDGESYRALPGGLLRSAHDVNQLHFGARHGGGSKDCWVLGGQQTTVENTLPVMPPIPVNRLGVELPSSQCDDLFWFGRYLERCEELARILRITVIMQREWARGERDSLPPALITVLKNIGLNAQNKMFWQLDQILSSALQGTGPAVDAISHLSQLTNKTQAYLSQDTWHQVQRLRELVDKPKEHDLFEKMLVICSAISGSVSENMQREDPWRFLELGRRLQRAVGCGRLLAAVVGGGGDTEDLALAVWVVDIQLTYRSRYRSAIEFGPVIDLIAYDEANPRGLSFQMKVIGQMIEQLPRPQSNVDVVETAFKAMQQQLTRASSCMLNDPVLKSELLKVVDNIHKLAEAIDHLWFSHALPLVSVGRSPNEGRYQR